MVVDAALVGAGVYLAVGVLFSVAFWLAGARRTDPAVAGSSPGFYVMVIPGSIALWPLLAVRWRTAARASGTGEGGAS